MSLDSLIVDNESDILRVVEMNNGTDAQFFVSVFQPFSMSMQICGPAFTASSMTHWGFKANFETIREEAFLIKDEVYQWLIIYSKFRKTMFIDIYNFDNSTIDLKFFKSLQMRFDIETFSLFGFSQFQTTAWRNLLDVTAVFIGQNPNSGFALDDNCEMCSCQKDLKSLSIE